MQRVKTGTESDHQCSQVRRARASPQSETGDRQSTADTYLHCPTLEGKHVVSLVMLGAENCQGNLSVHENTTEAYRIKGLTTGQFNPK